MAPALKKRLWFVLKLAISAGVIYLIFRNIWRREGAEGLLEQLAELRAPWVVASALALCTAIACSLARWQRLLVGQGIHAPWKHLFGTFMIGRFFGAVTPGGLGLPGYRIYDIVKYTGKNERAVASIGIEMVLGNLAIGIVVLATSFFGVRFIGVNGIVLLSAVFGGLVVLDVAVLWKPQLVRVLAQRLPGPIAQRLKNMVEAVCAYQGKGSLLVQAACLAVGTHLFNAFIYVFAAKALGVQLTVSELVFVSILQNVTAHVPISVNGVGLREAAAVGLYTIVGVPAGQALLIPIVGFTVEMIISSLGGLLLLTRKADYRPEIRVDDVEREQIVQAQIERVPESEWPLLGRGAAIGLGGGLIAGLLVGFGEAWAVAAASHGQAEPDLWFFGPVLYAVGCGLGGLCAGAGLAYSGRLMERARLPEELAFGQLAGAIAGLFAFVISAFRLQRDVFQEELAWLSVKGIGVVLGCLLAGVCVYAVLRFGLQVLTARTPLRALLRPWGSVALAALVSLAAAVPWMLQSQPARNVAHKGEVRAGSKAGNVLFIVVDTLRADHLPAYGYGAGSTPRLDAFAKDTVRFEQAYANASWTRPSFASLLTGRYPSSHGVMSKASSLPDEVDSLAEVFGTAGYTTAGIVTNYNIAPFFNFQQGFDDYRYLPPKFLFGASDSAAKLSVLQVLRRVDETARAKLGRSEPGSAYQDASVVNGEIESFLAAAPRTPWLLFVGYMDPHDPYYEHPYNGVGYSRAAHVKPQPQEADRLRKLYDGEISFWDEHFGALIDSLKGRGLYDDLTIVVTADHGEEFMEHGGFWHGTTLYDEQLHVPLFVKLPKAERAGTLISHWVESVDIMPSLLALKQISAPRGLQGVDLFRGKNQTFAEESHEGNVLTSLRTGSPGEPVELITANPGNPRGLAEREVYRLARDPGEHDNLARKDAALLGRSEQELEQVSTQAKSGALKAREVDFAVDEAAQERLKALGYAHE